MTVSSCVAEQFNIAPAKHTARIISQKEQNLSHILGSHSRFQVWRCLTQHLSVNCTWTDSADTDVVWLPLYGQNFSKSGYTRFRDVIGTQARELLYPFHAG